MFPYVAPRTRKNKQTNEKKTTHYIFMMRQQIRALYVMFYENTKKGREAGRDDGGFA